MHVEEGGGGKAPCGRPHRTLRRPRRRQFVGAPPKPFLCRPTYLYLCTYKLCTYLFFREPLKKDFYPPPAAFFVPRRRAAAAADTMTGSTSTQKIKIRVH